ncbi:hypothetical protein BB559_000203 [Furculomyces boomerangus]|uniref:Postreplication repair E3 ubiquitin-protein ligase RAD18 n=2 Tax=Harpellales TaxID=61421 RepID=A0A2T9Z5W6_9FUNG|nr:hypothetical protein BB559_000203 [Furculomyces boomerangus]PVZ97907.1 hypothetical protein BB558_006123 [Smittium angustum]
MELNQQNHIDDPSEWPEEFPGMREIDTRLRCPICYELLSGSLMSTNCGHVYCSLCIRRALVTRKLCPCCFEPLDEHQLVLARQLDELVEFFRTSRVDVLNALRHSTSSSFDSISIEESSQIDSTPQETIKTGDKDSNFPANLSKTDRSSPNADTDIYVECPGCQKLIQGSKINWHLDNYCKNSDFADGLQNKKTKYRETTKNKGIVRDGGNNVNLVSNRIDNRRMNQTKPSMIFGATQRKDVLLAKPSKLVYSILSDSKLKKILKDLGLPSTGTRNQLEARHTEWVSRYFANEDSINPKSHNKLLKELAQWEANVQKTASSGFANKRSGVGKKVVDVIGPSFNSEDYLAANADVFDELKLKAQQNKGKRKKADE